MAKSSPSRLSILFGAVLSLVGAATAWMALAGETLIIPLTPYRLPMSFATIGGLVVVGLGIVAAFLPPRLALAAMVFIGGIALVFGIGQRPPIRGDRLVLSSGGPASNNAPITSLPRIWESSGAWYEQFNQRDPELGNKGIPHRVARHYHPDFAKPVTYTLDENGWRTQPEPRGDSHPKPILFLGCSFTFGYGVFDNESFSAVLAAEAWQSYRVRNFAFPGAGTAYSCRALQLALNEGPPPLCVFYGFLDDHVHRNSIRKSHFGRMNMFFPRYEIAGGNLTFLGVADSAAANAEPSPQLDQKEEALTLALLKEMGDRCAAIGAPFFVLGFSNPPAKIAERIRAIPSVRWIDLVGVSYATYPRDGHPTAAWHRLVARAIAADPRIAEATEQPALYQPAAIRAAPRWDLLKNDVEGVTARFSRTAGEGSWRVDHLRIKPEEPYYLQLALNSFAVRAHQPIAVELSIRADRPRDVILALEQARAPWKPLGLWKTLSLGTDWRPIRETVLSPVNEPVASLRIVLGNDASAIEIREVILTIAGKRFDPMSFD